MPSTNPNAPADTRPLAPKLREATAARDALAAALTQAGIQLPAMDVRTPWSDPLPDTVEDPAEGTLTPAGARYALVHLGVCSAPVALALAAVIAKGATE